MGLEEFLLNRAVQTGLEQGIERGIEQEREERNRLFVTNLIRQTAFPDEQIADLAEVSVEFIQQVRREMA